MTCYSCSSKSVWSLIISRPQCFYSYCCATKSTPKQAKHPYLLDHIILALLNLREITLRSLIIGRLKCFYYCCATQTKLNSDSTKIIKQTGKQHKNQAVRTSRTFVLWAECLAQRPGPAQRDSDGPGWDTGQAVNGRPHVPVSRLGNSAEGVELVCPLC